MVLLALVLPFMPRAAAEDDATPNAAAPLEQLLAPVALLPDVILASVLPATTAPDELRAAVARFDRLGNRPLELPVPLRGSRAVLALHQVPDVMRWIVANEPWRAAVADAVARTPREVLDAIQAYRHRAWWAGRLDPQGHLKVVANGSGRGMRYELLPADPIVLYLPAYDTQAVVTRAPTSMFGAASSTMVRWGPGIRTGPFGPWAFHALHWGGGRAPIQQFDQPWHAFSAGTRMARPTGGRPWRATPTEEESPSSDAPTPSAATWAEDGPQQDAVRAPLEPAPDELGYDDDALERRSRRWYSGQGTRDDAELAADTARGFESLGRERRDPTRLDRLPYTGTVIYPPGGRIPRAGRTRGTGVRTQGSGVRTMGSGERTRGDATRTAKGGRSHGSGQRTPRSTSYWDWVVEERARLNSDRGWRSRRRDR